MVGIQQGLELKAEGQARVEANEREYVKQWLHDELVVFACLDRVFTSDDLRRMADACGVYPHHPNMIGAAFSGARKRGIIERVGSVQSKRKEAHGRWISQWRGVQTK